MYFFVIKNIKKKVYISVNTVNITRVFYNSDKFTSSKCLNTYSVKINVGGTDVAFYC